MTTVTTAELELVDLVCDDGDLLLLELWFAGQGDETPPPTGRSTATATLPPDPARQPVAAGPAAGDGRTARTFGVARWHRERSPPR